MIHSKLFAGLKYGTLAQRLASCLEDPRKVSMVFLVVFEASTRKTHWKKNHRKNHRINHKFDAKHSAKLLGSRGNVLFFSVIFQARTGKKSRKKSQDPEI